MYYVKHTITNSWTNYSPLASRIFFENSVCTSSITCDFF